MKIILALYQQNRLVFWAVVVFLLICIISMILFQKFDIALYINRMNHPFADVAFKYITEFGSFSIIGVVLLIVSNMNVRYFLICATSATLGAIITQICKRLIWYDSMRPKVFLETIQDAHFVEGVRLHSAHSFPSGHTAGAFSIFIALILLTKYKSMKVAFLLLAILTAYSRMYLSQHFLIDVTVGTVIGTVSALLSYRWFSGEHMKNHSTLNKPLYQMFRTSYNSP